MYNCYIDGILMPVTPSKMSISIKGKNSTLTLLNEGEINILKLPGLTEITLPLCFPILSAEKPPTYYLDILEKLKSEKKPTRFILTRDTPDGKRLFDTNIKVSVEDYEIKEDAENGLDMQVEIKLKQWRDYGTKAVKLQVQAAKTAVKSTSTKQNPASPQSSASAVPVVSEKIILGDKVMIQSGAVYGGLSTDRGKKVPSYCIGKWFTVSQIAAHKGEEEALIKEIYSWVALKYLQKQGTTTTTAAVKTERAADTAPKALTYTVQSGDTLWLIAKKYLGDGARYTEILNANKDSVSDPNKLKTGSVLKIPQ